MQMRNSEINFSHVFSSTVFKPAMCNRIGLLFVFKDSRYFLTSLSAVVENVPIVQHCLE